MTSAKRYIIIVYRRRIGVGLLPPIKRAEKLRGGDRMNFEIANLILNSASTVTDIISVALTIYMIKKFYDKK